ncbi:hypothetical protein MAPG_08685 [Magnaporthiopsis poae ATCC 64411]|uniref:Uncharacterized protein n=1 Tax=Magnaporthiopsis poae (strain ATCC 64411 / 73-15) TaxID=644358 RepID=A0A0C4E801_MAGP6|nr:hypothetical protein MAPG_08685 [Magnaporthiopsis poae ATCC 64411]
MDSVMQFSVQPVDKPGNNGNSKEGERRLQTKHFGTEKEKLKRKKKNSKPSVRLLGTISLLHATADSGDTEIPDYGVDHFNGDGMIKVRTAPRGLTNRR